MKQQLRLNKKPLQRKEKQKEKKDKRKGNAAAVVAAVVQWTEAVEGILVAPVSAAAEADKRREPLIMRQAGN